MKLLQLQPEILLFLFVSKSGEKFVTVFIEEAGDFVGGIEDVLPRK